VCTFDARTSTDESTPTLTYTWDFGNGGGSGALPVRTYTSEGTYTVTVTARDQYGLTHTSLPQDVIIGVPVGNVAPIPVLNEPSCALLSCNFSSVGSEDPNEGDSFTRLWDFGDGDTSTSTSPSHTFAAPGTYTVTLTVTDGWGAASDPVTYVLTL
jgi:PKD repeat protein